jgi:hypothetical protein
MPVRRATAFAGTAAALAALAHVFAGGSLPNPWLLLLGAAFAGAGVLPLVAREATWPLIVAGLAIAQGFLHLWMAALGHHHHGGAAGSVSGSRMLLAHVLATVVSAIWLRYGEQRLWNGARLAWVRSLIRSVRFEPAPSSDRPRTAPVSRPIIRSTVFDPASAVVRGPPRVVIP